MMKCSCFLSLILILPFQPTYAQGVAPEIVQVSEVTVDRDVKHVTMESEIGRYVLLCNIKAAGCLTPAPQRRYRLFIESTQWKMPDTDVLIDLKFVQRYTTSYPNGENIGLVRVDSVLLSDSLGIFVLISWSKR